MRTVHYKRSSLVNNAVGCLVGAAVGVWAALTFESTWMMLGAFLAVTLPFAAIALLVKAMGDCVAIQFDDRGIRVSTLFGGKAMSWPEVVNIQRETVQQSQFFGLYKKDISHHLVFTPLDGAIFGKLKINEHLLDLPRDSISSLIEEMGRAAARSSPGGAGLQWSPRPVPQSGMQAAFVSRQTVESASAGNTSSSKGFGRRSRR